MPPGLTRNIHLASVSTPRKAAENGNRWVAGIPLVAFPAMVIAERNQMQAWVFMWALSFGIFAGLKWMTWWKGRTLVAHSTGRSLAYLVAWPGMDSETFLDSDKHPQAPRSREWLSAALKTALGVGLLWIVARRIPAEQSLLRGWIGLFGLIFLLHFGSFHLIALFWQAMGIDAEPIMSKPILSKTLSEFWGKRWNLGFRQLAHDLIFRPLYKRIGVTGAGLLVFLASGLIHDLVISLPARGGYGLPTGYFVLQGLGVTLERSTPGRRLELQKGALAWIFMVVITAGPAFWLFHPPFVWRVILPFMRAIHAL
jgi:alginate O-acetyltransferase complex protein AlgI